MPPHGLACVLRRVWLLLGRQRTRRQPWEHQRNHLPARDALVTGVSHTRCTHVAASAPARRNFRRSMMTENSAVFRGG